MIHAPRLAASLVVVTACVCSAGGVAARQTYQPSPFITNVTVPTSARQVAEIAAAFIVEHSYPVRPRRSAGEEAAADRGLQQLLAALAAPKDEVRAAAVRALGQIEDPALVDRIALHIGDSSENVRTETARALVQAVVNANPEKDGRAIQFAFETLRLSVLGAPPNADVGSRFAIAVLESLGELPLGSAQVAEAVAVFSRLIDRTPPSTAAMNGLASLVRKNNDVRTLVSPQTVARLRRLALPRPGGPDGFFRPLLPALRVLYELRDRDARVINTDAVYRCPPLNGCWELRYLATQMIDGSDSAFTVTLGEALRDPVFHVRMAALRVSAIAIPATKTCLPLLRALEDPVPHVVLQGIDLMNPACEERDQIVVEMTSLANQLSDPNSTGRWQKSTHALVTLARFSPDDAKRIATEIAEPHETWQVRAAAARVAAIAKDEDLAVRLLKDDEANVRTEALLALAEMKSPRRVQAAVDALESKDYQLVLIAAAQLQRIALGEVLARDLGATVQKPLMDALDRLTMDNSDPSRFPRVEVLARVGEYGDPTDEDFVKALREFLKDPDPFVAVGAADALGRITGVRPEPVPPVKREIEMPEPRRGAPPPRGNSSEGYITLSDGSMIVFNLLTDAAPLTVGRFSALANQGFYVGLAIDRLVPGLLLQGGSPGANEYVGEAHFWSDEIYAPHTFGTLAVPTHGRHTGNGQFFINLLDAPQFNHQYTVFANNVCMTSHVLEGTRIVRVVTGARSPGADPVCVNR